MQVDTTAPLKRIDVESALYELKHFEFKLVNPFPADCDFDVSLTQRLEDLEAPAEKKGRNAAGGTALKSAGAGQVKPASMSAAPLVCTRTVHALQNNANALIRE